MDFLKKFSNKRKIKYGVVLAGFLAIIIAIVILFNVLITFLANRFNWYFDMTDEQFYTASDEFISAMTDINKDAEIEIVFFASKDIVEASYSSSVAEGVGLAYVNQTATQLAEKLPNVKVSYHSADDYEFVNQFKLATGDQKIDEEAVVVMRTDLEKPADGKLTQFEIYNVGSFYVSDSNDGLFAYNGENMLVEATIRLTTDVEPIVYFVVNHDECIDNMVVEGNTVQVPTITQLTSLFINAGYTYRPIDLDEAIYTCECGKQYSPLWDWKVDINSEDTKLETTEDGKTILAKAFKCSYNGCKSEERPIYLEDLRKREKMPSDMRALVIYEPKFDYTDNEVRLLESYLSKKGAIMTFLNANTPYDEMKNLYEFFEMWAGVTVNTIKISDSFNGVNGGFETVVPENTATGSYFPTLPNSSSKPVFNNSVYLSIAQEKLPGNAQTGDYSFTQTESLIKASNVASVRNATLMSITNTTNTVTNQGGGDWGNVDFNSYLMICASGDFADDSHILRSAANTQILRSLIRSTLGAQTYPTDVEFKVFNNYDLNITSTEKVAVFAVCISVLPLIALATGAVIIIRRRHR